MNQFPSSTERLISFFILDFHLDLVFSMNESLYFIKRTTLLSIPFINYVADFGSQPLRSHLYDEFATSGYGGSLYGDDASVHTNPDMPLQVYIGRSCSYITNL